MTAPSAFYRQHRAFEPPQVDDRHFRPAWRSKPPIDGLLRAKAITGREYYAACRFRGLSERAFGGLLHSRICFVDNKGGGPKEPPLENLDEIRELRAIAAALARLGRKPDRPIVYELLDAVIVQEVSWTDLAAHHHIDPRTARSWTITAIKALAAFTS
jgi:hypothetical protein